MSPLMMWSDAIVMAAGIVMFGIIAWHAYRRDERVRKDQSAAARLPFAMKDEFDGPA
jgi:cbb3-type cytochrome oxidase subunit 3